ncbi:MAG: cell division protein FtsH [Nitrospirae bacterium CG_4_10_14_0_8_um_filter_41_23]|nr:ATP-dependent metallopeptidase FtsH/Yme1/Tma family protein [Nitrospirota bacterium]OIP60923.1 MAG: cell division protein FtsH [Nitrospirae bacterium CG2_30_41_42]PIQ93098.1 MAG: cell division protein FtsH [Nitrospirae bacterium CG11_big_fil_rev_8_21_14_0_20_41_14]PIV41999.1 MAG: cell division protein FtsH [Nitrospirae bacterium CG02_land_8_20_14_3_00_41_53]PIW86860.1 MAG: cell division protein FtsH [Nitrospirae bacterium CG_4_8_14_3_um_filter_41_47]PIY87400.1 MAG: cell division protein Fts
MNAYKNLFVWLLIGVMMILLFNLLSTPKKTEQEMIFSEFMTKLEAGEVEDVTIKGNVISGQLKDGKKFKTYTAEYPDLVKILRSNNVRITAKPEEQNPWYWTILFSWGPIILLIGIWIFFMRQMQTGGNRALSFGKAKAKLVSEKSVKVTFADVAGIEEAKGEVQEIIDFLKDPQKFQRLGGKIPKGVLLVGAPGTGKTLLARAIAGEAGVPFFSMSGSDFVEMFVGVGASRVRDLFDQAKKSAPCIIFIDEIDAVGRQRGAGLGGGHDEREQTLNQLLVEMDGFESNQGVIILAATNRPDVLDPALLRPGRFDRQVVVPQPDVKGRLEIIKVHIRDIPVEESVSLEQIARGTPGLSGADLANLVNEAALLAARKSKSKVGISDFEAARDKVLMGVERKSMIISETEKRNTAYHEAGHTLVAKLTPGTDPIHKVSIIPRGRALGVTQQLPIDDKYTYSQDYLMKALSVLLGGRAAEEIALKHTTTGAGNDLERATELARKMVTEWGMSEKLGPLTFGKKDEQIFLGREIARHKDYSEKTAVDIDEEVKRIVIEAYNTSKNLLTENQDLLEAFAKALLEKETMDRAEIDSLIKEVESKRTVQV